MLGFALFHGAAVVAGTKPGIGRNLLERKGFCYWYTILLVRLPVAASDNDNKRN